MNEKFLVGIGQIASLRGSIDHNLELIEDAVERAAGQGLRLVIFPELALTGYIVDSRFADLAVRLDSETIDRLKEMSRKIDIVLGFIEETPAAIFYNSSLHLAGGKILHLHRKIYLPTYGRFDERRYYGTGWDVSSYDTAYMRSAMLICGDAWHLPLPYLAAHGGADLLVIIAASSEEGLSETTPTPDAWRAISSSYALTLSCFVAFANLAHGENSEFTFWGGSFVAGPDGQFIAESRTSEPDLLVAELDPRELRNQRIRLPFRRDDSLAHTIELGRRVLNAKLKRDWNYAGPTPEIVPKPR
jgi:predicted amidohydrolase